MLKKKYYDGMQVQSIITEELNDGKLIMQMLKRFADTPSADVRENVKGKWEWSTLPLTGALEQKCSICGTPFYAAFRQGMNFCPNCGADMREDNT